MLTTRVVRAVAVVAAAWALTGPGGALHAQAGRQTPPRALPLFAADSVLRFTLVTEVRALGGERDTLKPRQHSGAVVVAGADGRAAAVPVRVATRGHFRLRRSTCAFPPLRVAFDKAGGTVFAGQRALKLVTHCRDGRGEFEEYVRREYLAYRAQGLVLAPYALRARLARVRYVEGADTLRGGLAAAAERAPERWAMLLESERELERRTSTTVREVKGARWHDVADSGVPVALFQYFAGNTDFSLGALHNVRLAFPKAGDPVAVAYDLDFSGLVGTAHATPDPRLGIRTVRDRLWRGPCASEAALAAALRPYAERRDALLALWRDNALAVSAGYARDAAAYAEAFYRETRDVGRFRREVVLASCAEGT